MSVNMSVNMEADSMDTSSSNTPHSSTSEYLTMTSNEEEMVKFSKVATVAERWMIDFNFLIVCRYFEEGKLKEFNNTLSSLDAINVTGSVSRVKDHSVKKRIAWFLRGIMHGKLLDVKFDEEEWMTPLMSAINIWNSLKENVADSSQFENISNLLYVQSVAVCLQKGECSKAATVLRWLEERCEIPQNMGIKLSSIVKKKETYHPFLLNFSYARLLESVQGFVQAFLEQNPSDFLIKLATKAARSCPDGGEDSETEEDQSVCDTTKSDQNSKDSESKKTTVLMRPKKKLLSINNVLLWKAESAKKPTVVLKRMGMEEPLPASRGDSPTTPLKPAAEKRTKKKKWLDKEDQQLKSGVYRHGEGRWSRILLDYDFKGRTGVMLKDRWRVLKRSDLCSTPTK